MIAALVIARLLLAAVFAVAGSAKIADAPGSRLLGRQRLHPDPANHMSVGRRWADIGRSPMYSLRIRNA